MIDVIKKVEVLERKLYEVMPSQAKQEWESGNTVYIEQNDCYLRSRQSYESEKMPMIIGARYYLKQDGKPFVVTRHENLARLYKELLGDDVEIKEFVRPVECTGRTVFGELPFYMIANCDCFIHAQFNMNPRILDEAPYEELKAAFAGFKKYRMYAKAISAEEIISEFKKVEE